MISIGNQLEDFHVQVELEDDEISGILGLAPWIVWKWQVIKSFDLFLFVSLNSDVIQVFFRFEQIQLLSSLMGDYSFQGNFSQIDGRVALVSDEQGWARIWEAAAAFTTPMFSKSVRVWDPHDKRQCQCRITTSFSEQVKVERRGFKSHVRILKWILENGALLFGQGQFPVELGLPFRNEGRRSCKI